MGKVKTYEIVPFAWIWVPESQADEYKKHYDRIKTIPDDLDGNLCKKSNAILDNSPCDWTLILDDDISMIAYWDGGERIVPDVDQLKKSIISMFQLADQFGVNLWGINQNSDEMIYDIFKPFSLLSPVLGPFNGHLKPKLRYDESVLGKDDYDFWLQNILKHRKTLRFNKWHYRHDHGKMGGGFVSMRSMDIEKMGVQRMKEKWGKLFKAGGSAGGKSATGKNILNSIVKVPIKGC